MSNKPLLFDALQTFAAAVHTKLNQLTSGAPEDQLRGPFENFIAAAATQLGWNVVATGETPLPNRLGRPDYALHINSLLAGYVELKAPGTGVNPQRFDKRSKDQFKRFAAVPNMLYSDGNDWAIYRNGERVGAIVRCAGDIATAGKQAVTAEDAAAFERLLRDFLLWQPEIPQDSRNKIDLRRFADMLAPLSRLLHDDVIESLNQPDSPLIELAKEWRGLLFPDATDEQFADTYAQTVTFALLLGRSEGADPLTLDSAVQKLSAQHMLLSRALEILTDSDALVSVEVQASLDILLRVIGAIPPVSLTGTRDPWLYFYEDFLAAYNPELRKQAGAYYTPVEVVRAQVRLVDNLLITRLGKSLGFATEGVVTLDPAVGTGTYLLGIIEHTLATVEAQLGAGAVAGAATELAKNLYGFELMVGPYAVSDLRVSRAL